MAVLPQGECLIGQWYKQLSLLTQYHLETEANL